MIGAAEEGVGGGPGEAEGVEADDGVRVRCMGNEIPFLNCTLSRQ